MIKKVILNNLGLRAGRVLQMWKQQEDRRAELGTGWLSSAQIAELPTPRRSDPTTDKTQALPSVPVVQPSGELVLTVPRFVEYRRAEADEDAQGNYRPSPFMLLYGGVVASLKRLHALPKRLYIDASLLADLRAQSPDVQGCAYNGHFFFCHGGNVDAIPVHPASDLPQIVKLYIGGNITRDSVIAIA